LRIPELRNAEMGCGKSNTIQGASGFAHQIDVSVSVPKLLLIAECKRWKKRVTPGAILAHAARRYDIRKRQQHEDVKAAFATIVGYSRGAKKLADYFGVSLWHVKNEQEFVARIMNVISLGVVSKLNITDEIRVEVGKSEAKDEKEQAHE